MRCGQVIVVISFDAGRMAAAVPIRLRLTVDVSGVGGVAVSPGDVAADHA
jgi:hypothetical protein